MSHTSFLSRICRFSGGRVGQQAEILAAGSPTAKAWPVPDVAIVLFLLVSTSLGLAGCGHATVPCPTPRTELDHLRSETERLREETERVQTEEEAWNARRDAAQARAEEAQARLDSLEAGRSH